MPVRWGILGAGKIASDFVTALSYVEDIKVVAVAARDKERANQFGDKFNIPKRYVSYEELAADSEVDVIYVSTIHPEHMNNTLLSIQHGKNVLCEKPFTINSKQAVEVIEAAKNANVFIMEAMWTRFFPALEKVRELIAAGEIGEIQSINSSFGFNNTTTPRLVDPNLGGGAILDIGVYQISLVSHLFGGAPTRITSSGQLHSTQVDIDSQTTLEYGNKSASFRTCFVEDLSNDAHIVGTKGKIEIKTRFWSPETIVLHKTENNSSEVFNFPLPTKQPEHEFFFPNSIGMQYEAKHVVECLKAGKKESPVMPLHETLTIMKIMDEIRRQLGVKYPYDANF